MLGLSISKIRLFSAVWKIIFCFMEHYLKKPYAPTK